jgi:hypothetical protein
MAPVGEVVARRRSPAVKGSAADALSAIVAQIEASSPGSTKLGIANALRGLGVRASAAVQARPYDAIESGVASQAEDTERLAALGFNSGDTILN